MTTNRIIVEFDTDNSTAYDDIVTMLETTLPYMVDNLRVKGE